VSESDINEIIDRYSLRSIRSLTNKMRDIPIRPDGRIISRKKETKRKYLPVQKIDNSYRIFDRKTGFHSNHITGLNDGAWRREMSLEEQAEMMDVVTPWLKKYGFEI
jgi:hypothetical protein